MSTYSANIHWLRNENEVFVDNQYSRGHQWLFDGGISVPASASPHIVPPPWSLAENVDPEEAFVASLSSCHMLFFLSIAAKNRFVVDEYTDNAIGIMEKNTDGKMWMSQVRLRPAVSFSGEKQPSHKKLEQMHHQSHQLCFIANSVKTEVVTDIIQL